MKLLFFFLVSIPFFAFTQIRIDDVGDGWKSKAEQALQFIADTDTAKYNLVLQYCDHISYALTPYSTTESGHVILLATAEMERGSIADLAAAIVHESLHLYFERNDYVISGSNEEAMCYAYEIEFLQQIPGVDPKLIAHAYQYYLYFSEKD